MKNPDAIKLREPRIVCAACLIDGVIFTGARHYDKVMLDQLRLWGPMYRTKPARQGFIDQFGKFYDRKEALEVVLKSGQPFDEKRNGSKDVLYSEGVY